MKMRALRGLVGLAGMFRGEGLRARLVRGALGSAGVQAANIAFRLALSVVLARTLGPEGYGIYAYAFAIMSLLMVAAEAGVPTLLMREVAVAEGRGAWGRLRGALLRGVQLVGIASVTIAALGFVALALFADRMASASFQTMAVMLLVLPAAALSKTVEYGLMGLHKVVTAQALEMLLRPLLVIGLVGGLFFLSPGLRTPWVAMAGQLGAVVIVLAIAALLLKRSLPAGARATPAEFETRQWLKSALPFTLIGGALVINSQTDMVMLGWFTTADEVGVYRVAVQGAMLSALSLGAVNVIAAPMVARYHGQGERILMQRVVTGAARASTIGAVLFVAPLIIEGKNLLVWVFGPEYAEAYAPLLILLLGQFVTACLGISGPLLAMTGHEALQSKAIWVSAIGNVVANFILIPMFGMNGAAIATTVTAIGWIGYLAIIAKSRLDISVSPLPLHRRFR